MEKKGSPKDGCLCEGLYERTKELLRDHVHNREPVLA